MVIRKVYSKKIIYQKEMESLLSVLFSSDSTTQTKLEQQQRESTMQKTSLSLTT